MAKREPRDIWLWAFGEKRRLHEWVADPRCVVGYAVLYYRVIRADWPPEKAITAPTYSSASRYW